MCCQYLSREESYIQKNSRAIQAKTTGIKVSISLKSTQNQSTCTCHRKSECQDNQTGVIPRGEDDPAQLSVRPSQRRNVDALWDVLCVSSVCLQKIMEIHSFDFLAGRAMVNKSRANLTFSLQAEVWSEGDLPRLLLQVLLIAWSTSIQSFSQLKIIQTQFGSKTTERSVAIN